jgi:uncharacterized protein (DUF58 family)
VFAIIAVVAVLVGTLPLQVFGLTLGVLAVLAVVWRRAMRRGVELVWDGPVRVQPDTMATGHVIVRNRSRWPAPWVQVQLRMPEVAAVPHRFSFATRLGGRRQRRHAVRFAASARGVHEPGALTWRTSDPLGLVDVSGQGRSLRPTVIIPRLAPVRTLAVPRRSPLADQPDPASLFVDQSAIIGVRDYEPGDPLSTIHWPASAYAGTLLRKEFARASAHELLVCLDLSRDGYQRRGRPRVVEAAIAVAASLLADTIVGRRQQAGLAVSRADADDDAASVGLWAMRSGDRHLHALLDALARVGAHDGTPVADVVRRTSAGLHAGVSVVVVTGEPDDALANAITEVRRRGPAVTVLSVGSGLAWQSRVPARVAGVACAPVPADRPLERTPL